MTIRDCAHCPHSRTDDECLWYCENKHTDQFVIDNPETIPDWCPLEDAETKEPQS
jgi:hypothetical protein